jgi:molybdenum-dependent DNA-binding transcriptional regulator ModE
MQVDERIGRRLRLRDLNMLLTVVKQRSISKAAAHLAVSQPVVSKTIADMEHMLGPAPRSQSPRRRANSLRSSTHQTRPRRV